MQIIPAKSGIAPVFLTLTITSLHVEKVADRIFTCILLVAIRKEELQLDLDATFSD